MTFIWVDFETYWSDTYTLSKMTTQEYVRDPRFYAHGACVAVDNDPIVWYDNAKLALIFEALNQKYPDAVWCAHNALFDMTILSLIYNIHPKLILCTASLSRCVLGPNLKQHSLASVALFLLNEEKGKELAFSRNVLRLSGNLLNEIIGYCKRDVDLMRRSAQAMLHAFPIESELPVMTWVTKLMTEPKVELDGPMLELYHAGVKERKEQLLHQFGLDKKTLMSNALFADLLTQNGVIPPTKINAKGKITFAFAKTDEGLKELLEHDNEVVQAIVSTRLEVKSTIEETRSAKFAQLAKLNPVGVPLAYSGAVNTHRLSGRDKLNFQNLRRGGTLRDAICAPKGYQFVVSDLSQIELRITLCLAGHADAVVRMAQGACLYSELATLIYGVEVTRERAEQDRQYKEMRHVGKSAVLGCGFGMGSARFGDYIAAQGVKVPPEFAEIAVKSYRQKYGGVPRLWRTMDRIYEQLLREHTPFDQQLGDYTAHFGFDPMTDHPGVKFPSGLWCKYPGLAKDAEGQWSYLDGGNSRNVFGGLFLENLVQGLARCVIMAKTVKINSILPVVMSTHDEIVALVPADYAEKAKVAIHREMVKPVPWMPSLILGADTHTGHRYGEAK